LARSSFLKLASARPRASSIPVVNVISYSADGGVDVFEDPSSASSHSLMLILLTLLAGWIHLPRSQAQPRSHGMRLSWFSLATRSCALYPKLVVLLLGGIVETSASFEARSAPRSYPTDRRRREMALNFFDSARCASKPDPLQRSGG
jgi:hypothetical protein